MASVTFPVASQSLTEVSAEGQGLRVRGGEDKPGSHLLCSVTSSFSSLSWGIFKHKVGRATVPTSSVYVEEE